MTRHSPSYLYRMSQSTSCQHLIVVFERLTDAVFLLNKDVWEERKSTVPLEGELNQIWLDVSCQGGTNTSVVSF